MSKDGEYLEKIVQLIEKSIDPSAAVEHDVQMPILSSQIGATTQCDVVIRIGKPPRETITIVEVQDRNSKPAANDFRGWQQKLEDVGAQHLICVSKKGFSKSVKERARQSSNSINLITIKELNADTIPLDFFRMNFNYKDYYIDPIGELNIRASIKDIQKYGFKKEYLQQPKLKIQDKVLTFNLIGFNSPRLASFLLS